MKKLLLTSIIAISFATPSMADIAANANSATCNSGTLNTASGTSNLTAQWTPNTINITWDNNNATSGGTGGDTQCTYSSSFDVPSTPSRTGYTFGGWTLKAAVNPTPQPQSCFTSLVAQRNNINDFNEAAYNVGIGATKVYSNYMYDEVNDVEIYTPIGSLTYVAKCSTTSGSFGQIGTPSDEAGDHCWCAATSYTPDGGVRCDVSTPVWVYEEEITGKHGCEEESCGASCEEIFSDLQGLWLGL